jgi:hypothetical protein
MLFTRSRFALLAVLAAGCAGQPDGSSPAEEPAPQQTTATEEALTATQFASLFGKPSILQGQDPAACALGEVRLFAGVYPTNFYPADGRLIQITLNTALFAQMGTTYGGDGRTTFALPNLKAVTPNGLAYAVCASGTFVGNRQ